jgi:hypothetical protein
VIPRVRHLRPSGRDIGVARVVSARRLGSDKKLSYLLNAVTTRFGQLPARSGPGALATSRR